MATAMEVIRSFMSVLDETGQQGTAALDEAVRKVSGYRSWQALIDSMCNDCRTYGEKVFLKNRCGIILGNEDTGAISGSDAGGGTVKTAESVVPENGNVWHLPDAYSTTYGEFGLTVNWPNPSYLTTAQQRVMAGLYTWWIPEGLRLIRDSYGFTFNEPGTTVNVISEVGFQHQDSSSLAAVRYQTSVAGGDTVELQLLINMKYYENVSVDVNGKSGKEFYLDRVTAHELTHAAMAANIRHFVELPHYFKEGAAELVHGIDDERRYSIEKLAGQPALLQEILTNDVSYDAYEYAAGYMLLRYLAQQASGAAISPTAVNESVTKVVARGGSCWLTGYDPFTGETYTAYPKATELDGSQVAGNVVLVGNEQNNLIKGGRGASSLWGGSAASDTLQGGSGRDMFWFGAGDGRDVVTNFAAGDVLTFFSGSLSELERNGNSLGFVMSDGSTLSVSTAMGADAVIHYSWDGVHISGAKLGESSGASCLSDGPGVSCYLGGSGRDTLRAVGSGSKEIWLDGSHGKSYESIELLDGSRSSGADILAGGSAEEIILGGSGAASLWGGSGGGSDTMSAGSGGNVIFYGYGEGNDVVQDTAADDKVMLYNISLDELTAAEVGQELISITTTAGQTLLIGGQAGTFTLEDGSSWRPNRGNGTWSAV